MATQVNGIDVVVSDDARGFADGGLIDYVNSWYRKGFSIQSGGRRCC